MKASIRYFLVTFFTLSATFACSTGKHSSPAILSNIAGNVWVEIDANSTYNGEVGPSDVLVILYDNDEDTIVAQSLTVAGKFEFNGVNAGKYYIKIDASAFELGGPLAGQQSCVGTNDANDMVDNDDNGSDTTPGDVMCSPFTLSNTDPMSNVSIEYIDFCFNFVCEDQNQIAAPSCDDLTNLDIICDINALDGFCNVMSPDSSAGIQPSPLCDGFSNSYNISWFAFVAGEGNYSLTVSAFDCVVGNLGAQGIQVGVYTDCSFSDLVFCSDFCTTDPVTLGSSLLNAGQVYYLYINGCNGNVCSYQMSINGSPMVPSLEPDDVCIFSGGAFQCEDISYCPGADILFQGDGINILGEYTWKISTISGDPYLGEPSPITTDNSLVLNIPSEGTYEVCLTAINNGCEDQSWEGQVCREVTTSFAIPMPLDEDFGDFAVCLDDIEGFSINVFAADDPNGDGDFGWNAALPDYMLGVNEGIVYTDGCSYQQSFTLSTHPTSPVEDVLISVCEEDLPIQIDILTFSVFTFSGQQSLSIDSLLLQNTTDQNGCDSIINLTVEKLGILQGFLEDPICTSDGISIEFNYISDLSTDIAFLDFEWKDPQGFVLPFGQDPTSVLAPFDSGNGDYTLTVTINKNGVTCTYVYFAFVDIGSFLPPIPTITGPTLVCEDDNAAIYTAQGDGLETNFIWSFPGDVASATTSGSQNDTLTINWSGSGGGDITAIGQNICGQSDLASYSVQVIPKTTPNFSIDTSICIGNPATIDFIGSNLNIVDYSWNFDGGIVITGFAMGPYEVAWDTPGEKSVSLFTTDINGCESNETINTIPVKEPLAPTEVMCIPSVGEVLFTWEIPLMVSGFEVNVLSGQTGGVFTANSFLIVGLEEGEEVVIELLTKPEDPICGQFVSTMVSCTALDCQPPSIELEAQQSTCVDGDNITIEATITSGETGTGIFTGPGIIDAANGVFDPGQANIGINTIFYSFTSDIADCVGSKTISIEVFDLPIASFIQDKDTMCVTDILMLDYTGTLNADEYNWDFDGGEGSGLLTNQNVIFQTPGIKTISLQVTKNGCESNTITSTVFLESELEEVVVQCDSVSSDFVTFSWNAIDGVLLYEIKVDNNPTSFTHLTSITIDELEEEQEVSLTVTSLSTTTCPGSTNTITCTTIKDPVSTEDGHLAQIAIYPNPAREQIYLDGMENYQITYNLYSIVGKQIDGGNLVGNTIDINGLTRGIYILRIVDNDQKVYKDFKVIKK